MARRNTWRNNIRVHLSALLLFSLGTTALWTQTADPHQEAIVRATYAQLNYLTQLKVFGDAGLHTYLGEPVDRLKVLQDARDAEVIYTYKDFTSGPVSEIIPRRWLDLVSGDEGREVLEFRIGSQQFTDGNMPKVEWPTATAQWVNGPSYSQAIREKFSPMTVGQMLQLGGGQIGLNGTTWTRYTSFSMTISFQGKSSSLKAMFLFGRDINGKEQSSPQNLMIRFNSPPGTDVSFYPQGLLGSHLRETPIVAEWLESQAISETSCSVGKRSLCCSGEHCGVGLEDLHNELGKPLAPAPAVADKP